MMRYLGLRLMHCAASAMHNSSMTSTLSQDDAEIQSPRPHSDIVEVYSAGLVIPITAPSVLDGAIAVSGGRIEHVGSRDWVIHALEQAGCPT